MIGFAQIKSRKKMSNKIKVPSAAYDKLLAMRENPENFLLISAIDDLLNAFEPDSKMNNKGD